MDDNTESSEDTLDSMMDILDIDNADTVPQGDEESEDTTSDGDTGADDKETKAEAKVDWENRYEELRSMNDRRFAEEKAARARIEGQLEAVMNQQSSVSDAQFRAHDQKEQEEFTKEWMEKIEENPGNAVKYYQQMAQELIELTNAQADRKIDAKIQALKLDDRLRQLTPGWKEKQAKAESLSEELGIPIEAAYKVAEKYSDSKSVKQPNAPKVPGSVGNGRAPSNAVVNPVSLSEGDKNLLKMLGLDDKDSADIAKGMAAELAAIGE